VRAVTRPRPRRDVIGPPAALLAVLAILAILALIATMAASPASATPTPTPPPAAAAAADPPDSARARAEVERLRAEVMLLETEAETAIEAYNTARDDLQRAIVAELGSQTRLDSAQQLSAQRRAAAERRIRALYRAGPGADTVLVLFNGRHDLDDIALTMRTTRSLVATDADVTRSARAAVTDALATSHTLLDERATRVAAQSMAEERAAAVGAALTRQRSVLATADATLLAAIERERREADELAVAFAVGEAGGLVGAAAPDDVVAYLARASATANDPTAGRAIAAAATRLGMPYTWGATGPGTFDCSGLTQWAFDQAGIAIPRTSRQQFAGLPLVAADLQPGDLLFYASGTAPSSIHHVGLYVGDGLMIHAPRTGDVVRLAPIGRMPLFAAVRPAAAAT